MSFPTDEDVCNLALSHLGEYEIEDIYDASGNIERLCRLHFPISRRKLLRGHAWNFANRRIELVANDTAPTFGFSTAYDLPDDYLQTLGAWVDADATQRIDRFEIEANQLLANHETCFLEYVADITCANQWTTDFIDCLSLDLASRLATPLGAGSEKAQYLLTQLEQMSKPQSWINNAREDESGENNSLDDLVEGSNLVQANQTVI